MSRSGYSDDFDAEYPNAIELYRAVVYRSLHGARGQHFLRKLRTALDAMPVKRLITDEIADSHGEVCALGAVDPDRRLDPEDIETVAKHYGIARSMAAEIVYMNDEALFYKTETPEERWTRMRAWVDQQIGPVND
jgi:hypothetical protein